MAALVFCILWNVYSTAILFFVFLVLGALELNKLLSAKETNKSLGVESVLLVSVAYSSVLLVLLNVIEPISVLILVPVVAGLFLFELFTTKTQSFQKTSNAFFALIYVLVPFISLNVIGFDNLFEEKIGIENSRYILLGFFIILWTSDSMAYVTGKLLGKHKIAPAISPGKTWEGVFGGFVFSLLAGFLISYFTESSLNLWLGMAAIISIFGFLGDLSESMLKRKSGMKDSGNLLPGHGGVLDRFDGIIFSAPLVMCYLFWI